MLDRLKFWKDTPVENRVRILEREPFKVTIDEWRSDPQLCAQAAAALKSPILTQMLQTLQNSHPAFNVLSSSNPHDCTAHQKRCEGYTMALSDFELMASYIVPQKAIEPEFGEEEIPAEQLQRFRVPITQKARA